MTLAAAENALLEALDPTPKALRNFVLRGDSLDRADVTEFSVVQDVADRVLADVVRAVSALTRRTFVPYDPSYQTSSSQLLFETLSQVPDLAAVDAVLRRGDVGRDSGGDLAVAMAHVIGTGTRRVVAYRFKGPGIAARRTKGFTLVPTEGRYREIEDEVLYYEPQFDVFTCGDHAYFTNVSVIQTKLQADDKARELARTTLRAVTTQIEISGFDELERAVMDDPTLRAKMAFVARLVEREPEYAEHLTTEKLVRFVQTNPEYDIATTTSDGVEVLHFDPSPQHRHQIPRLLADDYLFSSLTGRRYEAGSKQHLNA